MKGILFPEIHAKWIHNGIKKLFVRNKKLDIVNKKILVLGNEIVYGVMVPQNVNRIDLEIFAQLRRHHLISKEEREKRFPSSKYLHIYGFEYEPLSELKSYKKGRVFNTIMPKVKIEKMRKPFAHPLGKNLQVKIFMANIPKHGIYVEPFIGAGSLFFAKEPSRREIINDLSPDYYFMLKFLRDASPSQFNMLKKKNWTASRTIFEALKNRKSSGAVDKFYRLMYLQIHSYANKMTNFTEREKPRSAPQSIMNPMPYKERLKGVKIYNKDFEAVTKKFDSPNTFYYIDPPYLDADIKGDPTAFKKRLYQVIAPLKGKWLLSFSNDKLIKSLFSKFNIKAFSAQARTTHTADGGYSDRRELLISNFPTRIPVAKKEPERTWLESYGEIPARCSLTDLLTEMSDSKRVMKRSEACKICQKVIAKEKDGEFIDDIIFQECFDYLLKTESQENIRKAVDFVKNSINLLKSAIKYELLEYSFNRRGSTIPLSRWFLSAEFNKEQRTWELRENPLERDSVVAMINEPPETAINMNVIDRGILYLTADRNTSKERITMKFSGDLDGAWIMEQNVSGYQVYKFIRRRGRKWIVVSESGKVLGEYDEREDAVRQLQAIEANKKKMVKGSLYKPFAGYKDFADCVNRNKNRKGIKDVKAYCGWLQHKFEKENEGT